LTLILAWVTVVKQQLPMET